MKTFTIISEKGPYPGGGGRYSYTPSPFPGTGPHCTTFVYFKKIKLQFPLDEYNCYYRFMKYEALLNSPNNSVLTGISGISLDTNLDPDVV